MKKPPSVPGPSCRLSGLRRPPVSPGFAGFQVPADPRWRRAGQLRVAVAAFKPSRAAPWISRRLVELAEVALCHFDGFPRRWRIAAAHRVVVPTPASFLVTHLPVVVVLISVDELPADHDANDIYGAHFSRSLQPVKGS
jgi:hypothetical protein